MKQVLLAATAVAIINSGAAAADIPAKTMASPPTPIFAASPSWGGFYIGVVGGYAGFTSKVNNNDQPFPIGEFNGDSFGHKPGGFVGGLALGYHWQSGRIVVGVEADAMISSISKASFEVDGSGADDGMLTKIRGLGTLRGRLGYAILDNVLVYATSGVALTRLDQRAGDTDNEPKVWDLKDSVVSLDTWKYGWVIGAGVEAKLTSAWSVRAEYLYADFGKYKATASAPQTGTTNFSAGVIRNDAHIGRVGLTYRFGGGSAAPVVARY